MVSGVFNHLCTWVDSSPIRLTRLLGSWPLDAPTFAPAVAHLSPDRGRVPCSCCCLASLVTFSGRQSPPLSCHRWPGSCARLAPRNALALQAAADSSLHPLSYSRFERACLVCFRGVSLSTQTAYGRMTGVARGAGKESLLNPVKTKVEPRLSLVKKNLILCRFFSIRCTRVRVVPFMPPLFLVFFGFFPLPPLTGVAGVTKYRV